MKNFKIYTFLLGIIVGTIVFNVISVDFSFEDIFNSFNNKKVKMHFSSSKNKKDFRSHNDYINGDDFINFIEILKKYDKDVDIMVIHDRSGEVILDIDVDDDSYRYRAIMNGTQVELYYSLTEHVEVPVGAYIEYQGVRYTLWRPENFKKHGPRNLEYTVEFRGDEEALKKYIVKDLSISPHKLIFSYTATPRQLLQLYVVNLYLRESGWKVGYCIEGV